MRKTGTLDEAMVRVQVVLGERSLSVRQLASIGEGTIVGLESMAGQPVDLLAAGETIARGEVVVIDENFGIRVTELAGRGRAP